MHVYVAVGELFRHALGKRLRVLFLDVLAVIESDDLVGTVFEAVDEREHGVVHVAALGEDLFVVHADDVPFFQIESVDAGGADSVCNLTCAHVVDGMDHVRLVFFRTAFAVEGERRRKALRHVFGGNDVYGAVVHQRLCLFRRQNDVLVVGEHKDVFCIDLLHGVGNVLRAGVHCLTALDDAVDEQILENGGNALARADGEHSHFLFLRLALGAQGAVLFEHIFDLHAVQFAQVHRIGERKPRRVGVDVDFDQLQIADADDRIADLHELFFELVDVRKRGGFFQIDDEKFGAVGKFDFAEVEVDDVRIIAEHVLVALARLGRDVFFHLFAVEYGQKSLINAQKPHAARIDHARFFEDGQKFGGLRQRFFPFFDDVRQKIGKILVLGRRLFGKFAHQARHREHGAFLGFGDCGISNFGAVFHRLGKALDGHFFPVFDLRADPAEQLRKNDAGISARTLQRALGNGVAQFGKAVGGTQPQLLDRRLDGERHIRARIAVRHGEHVE